MSLLMHMGTLTLGAVKAEARRLLRKNEHLKALRLYDRLLASVPHDVSLRVRVADVMAAAGMGAEAADVYRAVAHYAAERGHPLQAMVAAHALAGLGVSADDCFAALARQFAAGAPQLTPVAARPARLDMRMPVPARLSTDDAPLDRLALRARSRALDFSEASPPRDQFYPVPFFSRLAPEAFLALLRSLSVRRLGAGEVVIRQGDPGDALYLVAAGELRVFTSDAAGQETEVARIGEGSLFGEMALLGDEPRAASVAVIEDADLVEVSRATVQALFSASPDGAGALEQFARERLVRNLVATSPLFAPFNKDQRGQLLQRFENRVADAGQEIIRQGDPGTGLFMVLAGQVVVTTATQELARLGAGEIFGEMALLTGQPAAATVVAARRTQLLFLARTYVERLAAAIPQVRRYLEELVAHRRADNDLRLGRRSLPAIPIEIDFDHEDTLLL